MTVRIALCGPSGAGKTTLAQLLVTELRRCGVDAAHVRIAKPLYLIQRYVYQIAGLEVPKEDFQDTKLLSMLGRHVRDINSQALIDMFRAEVSAVSKSPSGSPQKEIALICSDARCPDLVSLHEMGFVLVYVSAPQGTLAGRIIHRGDINPSQVDPNLEVKRTSWDWDMEVDNSGTLAHLQDMVRSLSAKITEPVQ